MVWCVLYSYQAYFWQVFVLCRAPLFRVRTFVAMLHVIYSRYDRKPRGLFCIEIVTHCRNKRNGEHYCNAALMYCCNLLYMNFSIFVNVLWYWRTLLYTCVSMFWRLSKVFIFLKACLNITGAMVAWYFYLRRIELRLSSSLEICKCATLSLGDNRMRFTYQWTAFYSRRASFCALNTGDIRLLVVIRSLSVLFVSICFLLFWWAACLHISGLRLCLLVCLMFSEVVAPFYSSTPFPS